jgi:uncharacterized protein
MPDLITAVRAGDRSRVEEILSQNPAAVRVRDEQGNSPVLLAAYAGRTDLVMLLTRAGAQLDVFEAAATGSLERVRSLLAQKPDLIRQFSHDGWTPLHLAAYFGHADLVALLLERGASLSTVSDNGIGVTPLQSALSARRLEAARLLLEHGADVNDGGKEGGYYPLHYAAFFGSVELAELLLSHGARTDVLTSDGLTPLAMAEQKGHQEVAELLRRHEAAA